MQQVGEDAQFPQRLGEQALDLRQGPAACRDLRDRSLQAGEPQVCRHEVLRRRVVQLAGNALPFLFLEDEQLPGQFADLFLRAGDLIGQDPERLLDLAGREPGGKPRGEQEESRRSGHPPQGSSRPVH